MKAKVKIIVCVLVMIIISGCEYHVGWSIGKSDSQPQQKQNENTAE